MSETATSPASLGGDPHPDFRYSDNTSSDHPHSQHGASTDHQHCPLFPQTCKLAPVLPSQPHPHSDARDAETTGAPLHCDALYSTTSSEPKGEAKSTSPSPDTSRRMTATSLAHRRQHGVTETGTTDAAPLLPEAGTPQNETRLLSDSSHEVAPPAVDPAVAAEKARDTAGDPAIPKNGDPEKGATHKLPRRRRDLGAYWLLGFCNNFTYWVMITAAYDLLTLQPRQVVSTRTERHSGANDVDLDLDGETWGTNSSTSFSSTTLSSSSHNSFSCLRYSTGAILVADTLPATTLTVVAPLLQAIPTDARVVLLGLLCVAAYLTLGLANPEYVFLGVALASASRGLSDATFLGYASHFHKHVLSLWSSGTGVATFVGPLLYSALTTAGLPPRTALLSFLAVPSIIALSFWCLLSRTEGSSSGGCWHRCTGSGPRSVTHTDEELNLTEGPGGAPAPDKLAAALKKKVLLYMRALGYVAPLTAFYLIMYFTNQGLLELVYFPASFLSHSQQYAWANTARCFGTLISRSAHKLLLLPRMWMYVALAIAILVVVGCEAHFHFLPSLYVILTLLLAQGILEGSAFRSSMFNIYNKTTAEERSFCLAVFPVSLFLPAVVAGLAAIPTQSFLCSIHRYA